MKVSWSLTLQADKFTQVCQYTFSSDIWNSPRNLAARLFEWYKVEENKEKKIRKNNFFL